MKSKRQVAARAALLALTLAAALALNTTAIAQAPPGSLWYNGDWNFDTGLSNERNTAITQAAVYDDFDVTDPQGWHVTAVFSDNLVVPAPPIITGADWEIRIGVSEGNSGTLVASGTTNSPIVTPTGRERQVVEYMVEVTGLSLFLPALPSGEHYWLNVTPVGNGTGRFFNSTTCGANCVGTPCGNDDNAFWNSTTFGVFFDHTYNQCDGCNDFSMGVIGSVVPEPTTVALLTCGVGALLIALRRRRAIYAIMRYNRFRCARLTLQSTYFCAIGMRRPTPKARLVTFKPGAACSRLYSFRSTRLWTQRTVFPLNPCAMMSRALRFSST